MKHFKFLRGYKISEFHTELRFVPQGRMEHNFFILEFDETFNSERYLVECPHLPTYHCQPLRVGNYFIAGPCTWDDMEFKIRENIDPSPASYVEMNELFNYHSISLKLHRVMPDGTIFNTFNLVGYVYSYTTTYNPETFVPQHTLTFRPHDVTQTT